MSMKTKGVAFNMDCPHQKELLEWAGKYPNFSSYVKRLIDNDKQKSERRNVRRNNDIQIKLD